jgi:DNA repair protein RecN (Recombination protein N)
MLTTLRISGFAIVDHVEVGFRPGLNVLTGETGAGKSILLEALHLVLGGRMSADVLREGAEEAVVEALFELPPGHPALVRLAEAGLANAEGGEVVVRRTASRTGRGRATVNGALCTVGMLESSLRGLLDMTGQHEHVALLDERTHLGLLDAYAAGASPSHAPLPERYRVAYAALAGAMRERQELQASREERARRADYLAYQLREVEAAAPRTGEDAELERERQILASAEKLGEGARVAETLAYGGEGSAAEQLGRAVRALAEAAGLDARLEPAVTLMRSALAEVEEAGRTLAHYADGAGGDPSRLAEVEERLDALRALARKHGGSLEAVLARAEAMRAELSAVEDCGDRLARLEAQVAEAGTAAAALARELTRIRAEAAQAFCRQVQRELQELAMTKCRVEVAFLPPEQALELQGMALGAEGAERAQILLAPNPGEPARPLARVASGGELSRVLLAAKRVLARTDPVATYVFDEVDAGIGGAVAEVVGRLLSEVARERQLICVTHLPQVAAFADYHLRVHKEVHGGRTVAAVSPLPSPAERQAEIARMLAGLTVTGTALAQAQQLIDTARAARAAPSSVSRGARSAPARNAAREARMRRSSRAVKSSSRRAHAPER